jgi:GntR family L-lactate dehydrogenase operon transcriptional regulator
MQTDINDPKYIKLLEIVESEGIVGACRAQGALMDAGLIVSEPTAGRALRDMERRGLLEKNGNHGRKLTDAGLKLLREYRMTQKQSELTCDFANSLNPTAKKELTDLLVARRTIEAELARLAAVNISDADLQKLRDIVAESKNFFARNKSIAPQDTQFHMTIASVSRNKTLLAAFKLIWHGGQYSNQLERVRYGTKNRLSDDHETILEALAERNSDKAGKAMAAHINGVLRDVEALPDEFTDG